MINLERVYLEKKIGKTLLNDNDILQEARLFYDKLNTSKDMGITDINDYLTATNIPNIYFFYICLLLN